MKKLKLEDTCLTIEQAKELKELGVDFSNATMAFIDFYDENKHEYELVRNMSIGAYDIIPTLTNNEILEKLPDYIDVGILTYYIKIFKSFGKWVVAYNHEGHSLKEFREDILRDSLYKMLVYLNIVGIYRLWN